MVNEQVAQLLPQIQPTSKNKKNVITTFRNSLPSIEMTQADLYALFKGEGELKGLLHACGNPEPNNPNILKKSSEMALSLLVELISPQLHSSSQMQELASRARLMFVNLHPSYLRLIRLELHILHGNEERGTSVLGAPRKKKQGTTPRQDAFAVMSVLQTMRPNRSIESYCSDLQAISLYNSTRITSNRSRIPADQSSLSIPVSESDARSEDDRTVDHTTAPNHRNEITETRWDEVNLEPDQIFVNSLFAMDSLSQKPVSSQTNPLSNEGTQTDPLGLGITSLTESSLASTFFSMQRRRRTGAHLTELGVLASSRSVTEDTFIETVLSPLSTSFDPETFLAVAYEKEPFERLRDGLEHLQKLITNHTLSLKTLVRHNFRLFVLCKEMMDEIQKHVTEKGLHTDGGSELAALAAKFNEIHQLTTNVFTPLLTRRAEEDRIKRVLEILQRFRPLLDAPCRMREAMSKGDHERVVYEYHRVQVMCSSMTSPPMLLVNKVNTQVSRMVAELQTRMLASLSQPSLSDLQRETSIRHLISLAVTEDPAWHCVTSLCDGMRGKLEGWSKSLAAQLLRVREYSQKSLIAMRAWNEAQIEVSRSSPATNQDTTAGSSSPPLTFRRTRNASRVLQHLQLEQDQENAMGLRVKEEAVVAASVRAMVTDMGDTVRGMWYVATKYINGEFDSKPQDGPVSESKGKLKQRRERMSLTLPITSAAAARSSAPSTSATATATPTPTWTTKPASQVMQLFDDLVVCFCENLQKALRDNQPSAPTPQLLATAAPQPIPQTALSPPRPMYQFPGYIPGSPMHSGFTDTESDADQLKASPKPATQRQAIPLAPVNKGPNIVTAVKSALASVIISELLSLFKRFLLLHIPNSALERLRMLVKAVVEEYVTTLGQEIAKDITELGKNEDWRPMSLSENHTGVVWEMGGALGIFIHVLNKIPNVALVASICRNEAGVEKNIVFDAYMSCMFACLDVIYHNSGISDDEWKEDSDIKLIRSLDNVHYLARVVLPHMWERLLLVPGANADGTTPSETFQNVASVCELLQRRLISSYINLKLRKVSLIVTKALIHSGYNWETRDLPSGIRPHVIQVLSFIVSVHDQLQAPRRRSRLRLSFDPVDDVITSLIRGTFQTMLRCICVVDSISMPAAEQIELEAEFICSCCKKYMRDTSHDSPSSTGNDLEGLMQVVASLVRSKVDSRDNQMLARDSRVKLLNAAFTNTEHQFACLAK
eukprot:c6140_g1_i1.p1 GENE.c6140_g1_i1~~c6140_g1_i1.p1  ORF type:complete len:1227 (+),score=257.85 c6140_g1_i1:69-3749(+)